MFKSTGKQFLNLIEFIKFYVLAGNEHDVHSPFVFKLLTDGIYSKSNDENFHKIEKIRKHLLKDKRVIETLDLGAGSTYDGRLQKRSIAEITDKFAKSPRYCRLLYRITDYLAPETMIELGTSVGISAMYQSAGNTTGELFTLEGCPETAKIATENFTKNNFTKVHCVTGSFDDTLMPLLDQQKKVDYIFIDGNHTYEATMRYFSIIKNYIHAKSVIIFDDINWSAGMKKAWSEIKEDDDVTISIDFFMLGVVFFNKNFTKQNFKLRPKL